MNNKYDKMLENNKNKSEHKVQLAKDAIRDMQNNHEKINICELMRRTELSRSFFYNNKQVRECLEQATVEQQGNSALISRKVILDKATTAQVETLERQYNKVKLENAKLKEENEKLRKALHREELKLIKEL